MGANRRLTAHDLLQSQTRDWPEAASPVTRLMVLLFRLSDLALANAKAAIAAHGLRFSEFEVLVALRAAPPPRELAPTDLYGALLISSGGLTKVLASLQRRKLVSRPAAGDDKRSRPVRLTARGRALAERTMADVARVDGEFVARGLAPADVERLAALLEKQLAAIEQS
jgi:DNA-binding MarR family transcriptional regulator